MRWYLERGVKNLLQSIRSVQQQLSNYELDLENLSGYQYLGTIQFGGREVAEDSSPGEQAQAVAAAASAPGSG